MLLPGTGQLLMSTIAPAVHGIAAELQVALRRLRGRPVVAVTASLTLALGIGATTAVFSIVDAAFVRPLPYPQADRLVTVWNTFPHWRENPSLRDGWDRVALSWPEYLDLRAGATTLEDVALAGGHTAILEGAAEQVRGCIATANFFRLLGAAHSWAVASSHVKTSPRRG